MSQDFRPPWFSLYVRDFLASDRVLLMNWEEIGIYFFLLLHQWNSKDCLLPDDEIMLARLLGRGLNDKVPARVLACFTKTTTKTGPKLFQKKLRKIWKEAYSRHKAQSQGGKTSRRTRRLYDKVAKSTLGSTLEAPTQGSGVQSQAQAQAQREEKETPLTRGKEKDMSGASPPPSRKSRVKPWPEGFCLTPEQEAYGRSKGLADPQEEFEKFESYCKGNGRQYVNYDMALKKWFLTAANRSDTKKAFIAPDF